MRRYFLVGWFVIWAFAVAVTPPLLAEGGAERPERLGGLGYDPTYDRVPVRVDVFVRDEEGAPVGDLDRERFHLHQDGVEVPITHFARFTSGDEAELPTSWLDEGPAADGADEGQATRRPTVLVLYVDNRNQRTPDRDRVLSALQRFVRSGVSDRTQVMVVSHMEALEIEEAFTDDRDAVIGTLRRLRMTSTGLEEVDDEHEKIQQQIRRAHKNRHHSMTARHREISDIYGNIKSYVEERERDLDETLSGLRQVISALTGISGRKHLVYVSSGLPMALGADLLHQFEVLQARYGGRAAAFLHNKRRHYEALAASANGHEVTIHTVDATGSDRSSAKIGDSDSPRAASAAVLRRENLQGPLEQLAESTGGFAVIDADDFGSALDRIRTSLLSYYSIGYEMDSGGSEDTVHHIRVEIDDDRDLTTVYRKVFVEKSLESRVQDLVTAGLFFDPPDNPMDLGLTVGRQVKATETRWLLPVQVSLPVTSVAMVREGDEHVARITLFVATRDLEGTTSDIQREEHTFRLTPEQYAQRKHESFPIFLRLLLGSGEHRIAVGVLDLETHQTSFTRLQTTGPESAG